MGTHIYLQNGKLSERARLRTIGESEGPGAGTQCDAGRKERAEGGKERKTQKESLGTWERALEGAGQK